jgi:hypothetical protein
MKPEEVTGTERPIVCRCETSAGRTPVVVSWKKCVGCCMAVFLVVITIHSLFYSSSQLAELNQQHQQKEGSEHPSTKLTTQKPNSATGSSSSGGITDSSSIVPNFKDLANQSFIHPETESHIQPSAYQREGIRPNGSAASTSSVTSSSPSNQQNKPRTHLGSSGDDCVATPMTQALQRRYSFPTYANITDFVIGSGLVSFPQQQVRVGDQSSSTVSAHNSDNENKMQQRYAICEFQDQVPNAQHFTHSFQQIYGCWSFWNEHCMESKKNVNVATTTTPTAATRHPCFYQPVLLMANSAEKKLTKNPFFRGFLESLKMEMNLLVVGRRKFLDSQIHPDQQGVPLTNYDMSNLPVVKISVKGGYALQDAPILQDLVRSHYSIQHSIDGAELDDSSTGNNGISHCRSSPRSPRVGILNRRKPVGRSILNAERLAREVESALRQGSQNTHHNYNVTVMYFEGKSFEEQVTYFSSIDILVSPHGAQLTGIPFLGSPSPCSTTTPAPRRNCGALLELFPKGYLIPEFFGSLAISSGLQYGYLYLSEMDAESERAENLLNRIHARATNLCPPLSKVVDAVKNLIQDWETCRAEGA